jgi:hypothetical protein
MQEAHKRRSGLAVASKEKMFGVWHSTHSSVPYRIPLATVK